MIVLDEVYASSFYLCQAYDKNVQWIVLGFDSVKYWFVLEKVLGK